MFGQGQGSNRKGRRRIAAIRSETNSTSYTLKQAAYYIITALIIAGIVYRIGLLIF
jgi:ferrous iron transport protein B